MARANNGFTSRRRHKKVLQHTKGQRGTNSTTFGRANEAMMRSLQFAYRDRRTRKRDFRRLWITRINAAARLNGLKYGDLIHGLQTAGIDVDRKILAELAVHDAAAFAGLAQQAKLATGAQLVQ